MRCTVCRSFNVQKFGTFDNKLYWQCHLCEAKFLDHRHFLTPAQEKTHYLHHDNKITDLAYRNFLSQLKTPLTQMLSKNDVGLDYGCGNGPALADMFYREGFEVALYDPYFFPNKDIFEKKFDFITCTETVEHFYRPYQEFTKIDNLLKAGGKLGFLTCFSTNEHAFKNWHYRRDPTHVVFYNEQTFKVISSQRGWDCSVPSKDVVLISKPQSDYAN